MFPDNLELCREAIVFSGAVTLGIHSNKAGDHHAYTDGHAWISVHTPKQIFYLGLWPDGHPRVENKDPKCTDVRLNYEKGFPALVSRYYRLNSSQVSRLNDIVNKPDVWGYLNTCARWASMLTAYVVGVRIDAVDYIFFSTPRELGRHIQALEMKNPTSPVFPRQLDPTDFRGSSW